MKRPISVMAGLTVAAVVVAACSSGADSSSSENASGTTKITVGTSPSIVNLSLYEALKDGGAMASHGLDATAEVVTSGAQAVPLLLNGQLQFSAADPVGVIAAIANGVPLEIVAVGPTASADPATDIAPLLVKDSSGLGDTGSAYSGKTIAVNALNAISGLAVKSAIDSTGGDSSKVRFIEMPIPQMSEAIAGGTVDGGVTSEPYVAKGENSGLKTGLPAFSSGIPDLPTVVYITSKQYAAKNPQIVASFAEAMIEANTSLTANPDQARTLLESTTSVPLTPSELEAVIMPVFDPPTVDVAGLDRLSELMIKYGQLKKPQSLSDNVFNS